MSAQRLRCTLCDFALRVSDEDPDAQVDDMVRHVGGLHARDPLLGEPNLMVLESLGDALTGGE